MLTRPAYAQETLQSNPAEAQVIINGQKGDLQQSRDFVAGKLIIGRKTLTESGLKNVSEILRREPEITIAKDGRIGLMGLPGYTQILIDGVAPSGKDPLELDLIQVEKIEIIKSATAATGPFGIAGTINIISRKVVSTQSSQLSLGSTVKAGHYGANLSWSTNHVSANSPFRFNASLSASSDAKTTADHYRIYQATTTPLLNSVLDGNKQADTRSDFATATTELVWKPSPDHNFSFSPDLGQFNIRTNSTEQRSNSASLLTQNHEIAQDRFSSYSLPLRWNYTTQDDSQFEVKFNFNDNQIANTSTQSIRETDTARYDFYHHQTQVRNTNYFLIANYKTEWQADHEIEAGVHFSRHDSQSQYESTINNEIDSRQAIVGSVNQIKKSSYRLFIQDDWRLNKSWALNLGLSTEQQDYQLDEKLAQQHRHYQIWAPSFHLLKKIDGDSKRQLRISVARTFQAPSQSQLLLRPQINPLAPCRKTCQANTPDTPDSAGNPDLRMENAWGLNLSYTQSIGSNSEISTEYYLRALQNKLGSQLNLENTLWSEQPRYVWRPANLGQANIQGLNLTFRLNVRDLWPQAPKLELNGSTGYARSVVSDIPGPDNRIQGQSPWHLKLNGSFTMADLPLKLQVDANYLPADWLRSNFALRRYQSHQLTVNTQALWTINNKLRLSLNLDNLFPAESLRIDEYTQAVGGLQRVTYTENYRKLGLRMEIKL
ncbi:MAG: TonB-dependent receptor [Pseudomonadota bacterium]